MECADHPWLHPSCLALYLNEIEPSAMRKVKRIRLLRSSVDYAWTVRKREPEAQFLEFGVHKGHDIGILAAFLAAKAHEAKRVLPPTFHGFDSFRGLPEAWENGQTQQHGGLLFEQGHFDLNGVPPVIASENVELHPGWFDDTVAPFLDTHPQPVAFVHADADLYVSTMVFLEELARRRLLVRGTVITFDEYWNYPGWEQGEYKAWREISERYGIAFRYLYYHAPSKVAESKPLDADEMGPSSERNEFFKRKLWEHGFMSVSVVLEGINVSAANGA